MGAEVRHNGHNDGHNGHDGARGAATTDPEAHWTDGGQGPAKGKRGSLPSCSLRLPFVVIVAMNQLAAARMPLTFFFA